MVNRNLNFQNIAGLLGQRLTGWALGWASATLSAALALLNAGLLLFSWVWVSFVYLPLTLGFRGMGCYSLSLLLGKWV